MALPARRFRSKQQDVLVRVSVHGVDGRPFQGRAEVALRREGERFPLQRSERSALHEGRVPPGTYRLQAVAGSLLAPERDVVVGPSGKTTSAYLGEVGWPFYRMGEHLVPFPPPGNLLAVGFPKGKPDRNTVHELVGAVSEDAAIEACPLSRAWQEQQVSPELRPERFAGDDDYVVGQGAVVLLRFTTSPTVGQRRDATALLEERFGSDARVGVPVDLHADQVKVMDGRFVVRFKEDVDRGRIEELVAEAGGRILRHGFVQAPNTYLVEFRSDDFREPLGTVERWHAQDLLVYGEPDLMAEIVDDQFPNDPPDDPTFPNQANLTLQAVPEAWAALNGINQDLTLGTPDVHVMSLDRGLQSDHPDVDGDLTDGSDQVARCFDFSNMQECTAPGYAPETSHGMGVYGIIAARTDNGVAIAGIAPNTHQIALLRPTLTSAEYPDVLLWAAGFTTGNTNPNWPNEPLNPGAAIISCSHGVNNLALSGIMDDTLQTLADDGRGGLGTLTIYSAGNANTLITGFRTWAAHPSTMAIANTAQPDAGGVERKVGSSNYGPEIDVCAQGAGAPSLDDQGGEQTFGGTSAAAPTVAATAALMLSLVPTMTWENIRDVLSATAVKIDPGNTDPDGRWEDAQGNTAGDPAYAGPHFSQFYGHGRIDVHEAVIHDLRRGCNALIGALLSVLRRGGTRAESR